MDKTASRNKGATKVVDKQLDHVLASDPKMIIMSEYGIHDVDEVSKNIDKFIKWEIQKTRKKGRRAEEFKSYKKLSTSTKVLKLATFRCKVYSNSKMVAQCGCI